MLKYQFLIVEDDNDLREIIKWILENFGYKIFTAKNGREGLTIYKDNVNNIDLVITDIVMPEMSGKELYDQIRILSPEAKFLFMGGYTEDMIKNIFFYEEIKIIAKPFNTEELLIAIREIFES